MAALGWFLYLVLAVLLYYFWTKIRGASFDELLDRAHDEHIAVHKVLKKHPEGGTYEEYQRWLRGRL